MGKNKFKKIMDILNELKELNVKINHVNQLLKKALKTRRIYDLDDYLKECYMLRGHVNWFHRNKICDFSALLEEINQSIKKYELVALKHAQKVAEEFDRRLEQENAE